ncbi:MAG: RsmB/NOP family class I SAM-dependent RNA methyltransferase [Promethearchaeota archaeon]
MSQVDVSRAEIIKALVKFEESATSMRTLLRQMQTTSPDSYMTQAQTHTLALSVVRYRNTIDFILSRSFKRKRLHGMSIRDRSILRLALFDFKWLQTELSAILSSYPEIELKYLDEFSDAIRFNLDESIKGMPEINRLSLKFSHPTFMVNTLLENLNRDETIQLLNANNQGRIYYIRPNRLYDESESVLESLDHVKLQQDSEIPEVSQVVHGIDAIVSSKLFKEGRVILQDKGSVLVVNALNPQPSEKIWDACAAPGMKTQLIAERMMGEGQIVASDVYKNRVETAIEQSKRFNADSIEWMQSDATKPEVHDADKILIDAPCTSTGILQTYPSFKWRLNKDTLFALMTVQNKILDAILTNYADKPGTEIVFSTCSILPHEGESQIDSAMQHHKVELLQPLDYGCRGYSGFDCSEMVTRLFPHRHNTGGFFIARLRIKH